MILTGHEIRRSVATGGLAISPFSNANLNPNSYNFHLGNLLKVSRRKTLDAKTPVSWKLIEIPSTGLVLRPNKLYLASTKERIGSEKYVITLIGRSSLGRLGLFVQLCADLGHLGTYHSWTLELHVVQPLKIYPGIRLGQICFWQTRGALNDIYSGRYGRMDEPTEPLLDGLWR